MDQVRNDDILFIPVALGPSRYERLAELLAERFNGVQTQEARSLFSALQESLDAPLVVALIPESLTLDSIEEFKRDLSKARNPDSFQLVQLCPHEYAVKEVPECFRAAITEHLLPDDLTTLKEVFADFQPLRELEERRETVESATELALRELDRVAEDRKRGRDAHVTGPGAQYLQFQVGQNSDLAEGYFGNLESEASKQAPADAVKVEIPTKVVARQLPHLGEDGYSGVSSRVWKKLKSRYGNRGPKS